MALRGSKFGLGALFVFGSLSLPAALQAATTAEGALRDLHPVQKDVEYDRPPAGEVAKCTIKVEKVSGKTGYIIRDPSGQTLRSFVDTNSDNYVDQWSYFKDGLEVYRDIDSNFNQKADQSRWLNLGGTRWGIDRNEDGTIDSWKVISAEEVTAEVVAAMRERDNQRFARLLITPKELGAAGFGKAKSAEITKRLGAAVEAFQTLAKTRKSVGPETKWVYFGGTRPGILPAGADDNTADVWFYENVAAMTETDGKHGQLPIGTLVKVQDAWRLLDAPQEGGLLIRPIAKTGEKPEETAQGGPSQKTRDLLEELAKLDQQEAVTPAEQAKQNIRRADLLEQLADAVETREDRSQWLRQLADTVSAAVQSRAYPEGVARLKQVHERLKQSKDDADLAAYVEFRYMTAEYGQALQKEGADYPKVQAQWLQDLERYVTDNPKTPDSADAMLQLGIAQEFAGDEQKALKWYDEIVRQFRNSTAFAKAQGAKWRLESVGKTVQLRGKGLDGKTIDLSAYRGKIVLIQLWATWAEPCKNDLPLLRDLYTTHRKDGFEIIGISLDTNGDGLANFIEDNRIRWPQIYEPGGLDSRIANELGVLTLPTMLLVGKDGKIINRSVHAAELAKELKPLFPSVARRPR